MSEIPGSARPPLIVTRGQGRRYSLGQMGAVFIADGAETDRRYSISEWTFEAGAQGPGPHAHNGVDHVFYVIEGTLSVFIEGAWSEAPPGSYVVVTGGTRHDFANRGDAVTRFINIDVPGGFESAVQSFAEGRGP